MSRGVGGALLRAANICWQVARTYLGRYRFWIFGISYVLLALWWGDVMIISGTIPSFPVIVSAILAATLSCFVALHLRRQFGTPAAKVIPQFAAAHLAVGAAVSLLVCVGVPAAQAHLLGLSSLGSIGLHACAGLLLVAVVCWRPALLLLTLIPVGLVSASASTNVFADDRFLSQFIEGRLPLASAAVIGLTLAAYPLAAWRLLRMSDQQAAVSDDFSVEMPRGDQLAGRWEEFLWWLRDRTVRHRLADANLGWWSVQRWRTPTAISPGHLVLATLLGLGLTAVSGFSSGKSGGAVAGVVVASAAMLMIPFGVWHLRRATMSVELLRPVRRGQYVRQIAVAMALDMITWAAVASALTCGAVYFVYRDDPLLNRQLDDSLTLIWSGAVLLYGAHLATLRMRYWLPLLVGVCLCWLVATGLSYEALFRPYPGGRPPVNAIPTWFALWAVTWGVLLTGMTLARWLRADIE